MRNSARLSPLLLLLVLLVLLLSYYYYYYYYCYYYYYYYYCYDYNFVARPQLARGWAGGSTRCRRCQELGPVGRQLQHALLTGTVAWRF